MPDEPLVLSVNALDASGEDGLVTDAAVVRELGCRSAVVATCVLLGRNGSAGSVAPLPLDTVSRQLQAARTTGTPASIRIGTVVGPDQIEALAEFLEGVDVERVVVACPLRWNGAVLLDDAGRDLIERKVLSRSRLMLVRVGELRHWTGVEPEGLEGLRDAAATLRNRGAPAVLVTGGVARGRVVDYVDDGGRTAWLDAPRIKAPRLEGLSDAHAAAVTAYLGKGCNPFEAARAAQRYVGFRLSRSR